MKAIVSLYPILTASIWAIVLRVKNYSSVCLSVCVCVCVCVCMCARVSVSFQFNQFHLLDLILDLDITAWLLKSNCASW